MDIAGVFLEPWGVLSMVSGHMGQYVLLPLLSFDNPHGQKFQLSSPTPPTRLLIITGLQNCSGLQNNWTPSLNEYRGETDEREMTEKSPGCEE